jgi:uncharacterized membrane protein YkvA (DUF1232 family)
MNGGPLDRVKRVLALLRDPRVPRLPRILVGVAVIYLLSPVDLVPELLTPLFGFLDDALMLWLSIRWLVRSGPQAPAPEARVVETSGRRLRP